MSSGRIEAARHLREKINQAAEERELGVEITFVGLQDIHPPVKVADAYEAVINAEQEKEAKIYQAKDMPWKQRQERRQKQLDCR